MRGDPMSIPGIPGAGEPAFRTRDARWMGLDALVQETRTLLAEDGIDLSLVAVKATIQMARLVVQEPVEREADELVAIVSSRLRDRSVIMPPGRVQSVLTTYAQVIVVLDILEINEFA